MKEVKTDEEIEATALEVLTHAFELAMKEINDIAADLHKSFTDNGALGMATHNLTDTAKERYILGGLYMLSSKGARKKIIESIIEKKKEERDQLLLPIEEATENQETGETDDNRNS